VSAPEPNLKAVRKAARKQRAYGDYRAQWADEVCGRPYTPNEDLRPPPGEIDEEDFDD
jgi:hypothetical protein